MYHRRPSNWIEKPIKQNRIHSASNHTTMSTSLYYFLMVCTAMALPMESNPILAPQHQKQTNLLSLESRNDLGTDEATLHWIPARAAFALLCLFIFFVVLHVLQATIFHKVCTFLSPNNSFDDFPNIAVADAVMGNYQGDYFKCKEERQIQLPDSP